MAQDIYDGTLTAGQIDPQMTKLVAEYLHEAVLKGYTNTRPLSEVEVAYNTPDTEMIANLQKNVYQFAAAKNYQQLKDLTLALTDDNGKVRKFKEFSNVARQLNDQYNINWLQTEYNTAIGSGQMAGRWVEFEANKDAMPLLRYQTAGDARVRTDHRLLDNITRPVDDDFWDKYYPPNGWGCRCDVVQLPSGTETPADKLYHPEVPQMWSVNLAKRGLAFPPGHPFYKGVPGEIIEKGKGLIEAKRTGFIPANSVSEAQTQANDYGLAINKIDYKKIDDIDIANQINNALKKAKDEYGIVYDEVIAVNRKSDIGTVFTNVANFENGSLQSLKLTYNVATKKYLSEKNIKFEDWILDSKKEGYWVCENIEDFINHEIGHNITTPNKLDDYKKRQLIMRFADIKISKYGSENGNEGLAEIWCQYKKTGTNDLKPEWIDFFNKYSRIKIK